MHGSGTFGGGTMSNFVMREHVRAALQRSVAAFRLHRFRAGERGAVAVFLAFAVLPLLGFVGIGTDVARAYLVKSRLSSALDAAGLAGGRSFYEPTRDADIDMFFTVNFPPGYMGAALTGPTKTIDEAAETIHLYARADVPTTFMTLFGFDQLTVDAEAEVTRRMTALDVVLAIDMSGSMSSSAAGGGSRIEAARDAAEELVDILYGDNASSEFLNVGLVPWNSKVNVQVKGTIYDPALTVTRPVPAFVNPETGAAQSEVYVSNASPVPLLSSPPSDWRGCVYSRYVDDGLATSDADILAGPATLPDADWPAWQPVGPEGEPVSGGTCSLAVWGYECIPCLGHGITPLGNVKQTIVDAIAELVSPTGSTNIPQGLGWAWRVLRPEAPFTEAVLDPDYERTQAIVLLTDGENFAGSGDGYKTVFGQSSYGQPGMDARLELLADNIKADGVVLYVIQFANAGTGLQELLKGVASGPDSPFYHYAPDAAALTQVFREVASHLSELRLSK